MSYQLAFICHHCHTRIVYVGLWSDGRAIYKALEDDSLFCSEHVAADGPTPHEPIR